MTKPDPRRQHFLVRYLGTRVERSLRIHADVPGTIVFAGPGFKAAASQPEPVFSGADTKDSAPAVRVEFGELQS